MPLRGIYETLSQAVSTPSHDIASESFIPFLLSQSSSLTASQRGHKEEGTYCEGGTDCEGEANVLVLDHRAALPNADTMGTGAQGTRRVEEGMRRTRRGKDGG
jgi:hypothetical protein